MMKSTMGRGRNLFLKKVPRLSPLSEARLWLLVFICLALLVAFRWQILIAWDTALLMWCNQALAHPFLDTIMLALSRMGKHPLLWLVLLGWLAWQAWKRNRTYRQSLAWWIKAVLALAITIGVSDALCSLIAKPIVHRERPPNLVKGVRVVDGLGKAKGFPSAHAANAFAAARVLHELVQPKPLWWGLASAIAFSRVYLGVHFPADIFGGALLGLSVGALTIAAWRRLTNP